MPVQILNVAILPEDLPYSGPVTHSGEFLTTGKSYKKCSILPETALMIGVDAFILQSENCGNGKCSVCASCDEAGGLISTVPCGSYCYMFLIFFCQ